MLHNPGRDNLSGKMTICRSSPHEAGGGTRGNKYMRQKNICMFNYKGKRWRELSSKAMRRDGYMCQISKRYGKQVPAELVHHIYPVDEYPEYGYCLWNLISLSRAMHNTLHDRNTDKLTAEGVALVRRAENDRKIYDSQRGR